MAFWWCDVGMWDWDRKQCDIISGAMRNTSTPCMVGQEYGQW